MIVLAGHVLVDVVARYLDNWPTVGTLTTIQDVDLRLGGCVPNTGRILSRLGIPVAVVGRVGTDELGSLVASRVRDWATWQLLIPDSRRSTSATVVIVGSDGERTFLHTPGANAGFNSKDIPLRDLISRGARCIHIGYVLLLDHLYGDSLRLLLQAARSAGLLVSIDVTWAPGLNWAALRDLLPLVDIFCPNMKEAEAITGCDQPATAAEELVRMGVQRIVAIKLGADGCFLLDEHGGARQIRGHQVKVVDATGAGDAFVGGMLAGWHKGLDWEASARIANAAAAAVVTKSRGIDDALNWDQAIALAGLPSPHPS